MEVLPWLFNKSQFVPYMESCLLTSHGRLSIALWLDLFTGLQGEE